jgi:hypothetical protein
MIYLVTIGLLLALLLVWVVVEYFADLFAHRHPEFGPSHKVGCGGCGNHCAGHCKTEH